MGGQAGIGLVGGFVKGYANARRQAEEQEVQKEYKNILTKKMKTEIDLQEQIFNIDKQLLDPNIDEPTAYQLVNARARLSKQDPMEAVLGYKITKRLISQGGQPRQQIPVPNQDGNLVEDPNAPFFTNKEMGITNPFESITQGLTPDEQDYLFKKTGIGRSQELGPNITNAVSPTGERSTAQQTKTGRIVGYVPTMPSHIEWVEHPTIPGIQIGYADGKPTGEVRQVAQGYDVKEVKKKLPDGSETTEFIHVPKRPGGLGTPKTALPGQIQMVIDPNKPGAIDEAITGLRQVQQQGAQKALTGGGRGGIQTGPATRGIHLTNKELSEYIDVNTGKPPKGQWTQDSIDASKQYVRKPEKVLGTEEAAKLGNAIEAVKNLPTIKERMFPGGQLDKDFSQALWLWYKSPEAMAGSEVAEYGKMLKQAIEAQIRLESGAAVPPEEIKRASERYITQLFSTPESVSKGFDMITNTLGTTVEMADPTGYYRAVSAKGRVDTTKKTSLKTAPEPYAKMLDKLKKTNPTTPVGELEKYLKGKYKYGN